MDAWDPGRALVLIERERCTVLNAVDTMVLPLLEHPDLDRHDRRTLRTGGFGATGGAGPDLVERVAARLGVPFAYQPYGMTEVNALALLHHLDEPLALRAQPGVRPAPGIEVRVIHPETGARCRPGEPGELQFRGPLVTPGYYRKPEETAAAFTADGWFRTGDLGVRDDDDRTIFKRRLRQHRRISEVMGASR
jgi:fatty-acyl-CoA synthase